jgi:AraC-like DNA-binding protein
VVLDESRLFWMRWHPESLVCNLRLDAGSVHRFILDIIVDTVPSSTFELVAPETRSDRIRWQSVVRMLNQLAVLGPPDPAAYPIWSAEVERFAVSAMLTTHSNHVMEAVRPQANAAASQVAARQAAEYLRANCAEPIVLQGLGPKFGVSTRSIQLAFQQLYDCSPREYLREMRLQSAHLDLMSDPDAKITDIGFRWGFSTPGRFAREYRRRFGILPSEVVRQTTLEVKEQSLDVGGKS